MDERLSAKPGIDSHEQNHVHIRQHHIDHAKWCSRVERNGRPCSKLLYVLDHPVEVYTGFGMDPQPCRPRFDEIVQVTAGFFYHQMNVQREACHLA
jgi:hypothetical protein